MVEKKALIKFAARCRDQDRQYEINNNCELDNGVYHKFVYSSHEGGEKPVQGGPPIPQKGESTAKKEEDFDIYQNQENVHDRQALQEDGALSTKMKQSTRNNNKAGAGNEASFIQSFEQPSEDYEEMERRIQSAKLEKRATNQLLPNG